MVRPVNASVRVLLTVVKSLDCDVTSRVQVDRSVIGVNVEQKRSEDTALWQAFLLGSPSTALSTQDNKESPVL